MLFLLMTFAFSETVANGLVPASAIPIDLVPQYTLGGAGQDEDLMLGAAIELAVDSSDNLYMADSDNMQVLVFDRDGKKLRQFGTRGQGPGEFQGPLAIAIDAKEQIVVFDATAKRMTCFSSDGTYLSDVSFEPGIQVVFSPLVLPNGAVALCSVKSDATFRLSNNASLYDETLKPLAEFVSISQPQRDWSQTADPKFWVDFLKDQFESIAAGYPMMAMVGKDRFVVIRSNAYKGDIMDASGKSVIRFSREIKPKAYTEEGRHYVFETTWNGIVANPFLERNLTKPVFEKAAAQAEKADFMPPVIAAFSLGEGFAIISNLDPILKVGDLDVFNAKGKFIATTQFKGALTNTAARGDRIYIAGLNDEDDTVINCYKVHGIK